MTATSPSARRLAGTHSPSQRQTGLRPTPFGTSFAHYKGDVLRHPSPSVVARQGPLRAKLSTGCGAHGANGQITPSTAGSLTSPPGKVFAVPQRLADLTRSPPHVDRGEDLPTTPRSTSGAWRGALAVEVPKELPEVRVQVRGELDEQVFVPPPSVTGGIQDVASLLSLLQDQLSHARSAVEAATQPDKLYRALCSSPEMSRLFGDVEEVRSKCHQLAEGQSGAADRFEDLVKAAEAKMEEAAGRCESLAQALELECEARRTGLANLQQGMAQGIREANARSEEQQKVLMDIFDTLQRRVDSLPIPSEGAQDGPDLAAGSVGSAAFQLRFMDNTNPVMVQLQRLVHESLCESARLAKTLGDEKEQRCQEIATLRRNTELLEQRVAEISSSSAGSLSSTACTQRQTAPSDGPGGVVVRVAEETSGKLMGETPAAALDEQLSTYLVEHYNALLAELDGRFAAHTALLHSDPAGGSRTAGESRARTSSPPGAPGGASGASGASAAHSRGRSLSRSERAGARGVRYASQDEVARVTNALAGGLRELDRRLLQERACREASEAGFEAQLHDLSRLQEPRCSCPALRSRGVCAEVEPAVSGASLHNPVPGRCT